MSWYDIMASWLPSSFLGADAVTQKAFLKACGRQSDDLETAILDNQNQLFAQLATWALNNYEEEYGIKLVDGATDSARQNNVVAKMRAGQGATPAALLNVLAAYGCKCRNCQILST
ncbi:putative phage tail protein [Desulfosporosinus sp. FKA]|uniref:putative phage tail protein n=1 Tax=Desulfosporosinus sp. FKA TaxID=1969834 RepID=UPI000B49D94F|nr:putative phage tail protein [Desulfosporosinus sp. FKA]